MSAGEGAHAPTVSRDLALLAPGFARAVQTAIAECNAPPAKLDAMVYEGYRSAELQALYYRRGRTVIPPTATVTNARSNLQSWHGFGLAVDVVHRTRLWKPDGGEAWFRRVAGVFKRHGCRWGGDWTKPDTPHMQWGACRPSPSDEARRLLADEGISAVWDALGCGAAAPSRATAAPPPAPRDAPPEALAWGGRVSDRFRARTRDIAGTLGIDPSHLMACMAFETGEAFAANVRNTAGSGAVGLIQFMPATATALGTTVDALAAMTADAQLDYVARYLDAWAGRLRDLGDVYMAILWPAAIGRADDHPLFERSDPSHPARYRQNAALDANRDGVVTRGECLVKVRAKLDKGLLPQNRWPI